MRAIGVRATFKIEPCECGRTKLSWRNFPGTSKSAEKSAELSAIKTAVLEVAAESACAT
jgi:hypothetical protein